MNKAQVFKDQSSEELIALERDKRKELFELETKRAREKKLDNPSRLRAIRKDIARILTVLKEKELAS